MMGEDSLEEKLITTQLCNNNITNDMLYQYILMVGADEILFKMNDYEQRYLDYV